MNIAMHLYYSCKRQRKERETVKYAEISKFIRSNPQIISCIAYGIHTIRDITFRDITIRHITEYFFIIVTCVLYLHIIIITLYIRV